MPTNHMPTFAQRLMANQAKSPSLLAVDCNGDALPNGARIRLGAMQIAGGGRIAALTQSPDKSLMALCSGNSVTLIQAASGRFLAEMRGHFHTVNAACFYEHQNLPRLASTSKDGTLRYWDVISCQQLLRIDIGSSRSAGCALYHCSEGLWVASYDALYLYDFEGKLIREIKGFSSWPHNLTFNTSHTIAWVDCDNGLWEISASEPLFGAVQAKVKHLGETLGQGVCTIHNDSVLVGTSKGVVRLHHNATLPEEPTFATNEAVATLSCFEDEALLAASTASTVYVWDLNTAKIVMKTPSGRGGEKGLALTRLGTQLVCGGFDGAIRRHSLVATKGAQEQQPAAPTPTHGSYISAIAASFCGTMYVTAEENGAAYLWRQDTGAYIQSITLKGEPFALSPVQNTMIASVHPSRAALFDISKAGFKHRQDLKGTISKQWFRYFAFSNDGQIVAGCSEGALIVWRVCSGKQLWHEKSGSYRNIAVSPPSLDGKRWLAAAKQNGSVDIYDVTSGKLHSQLDHGVQPGVLHFVDSARLLTGAEMTRLWQIADDAALTCEPRVFPGSFLRAVSQDSRYYLCDVKDSSSKNLEVRQSETGDVVQTIDIGNQSCVALTFCADGRECIGGGHARSALVWPMVFADSAKPLHEAPAKPKISDVFSLNLITHSYEALPFGEAQEGSC